MHGIDPTPYLWIVSLIVWSAAPMGIIFGILAMLQPMGPSYRRLRRLQECQKGQECHGEEGNDCEK